MHTPRLRVPVRSARDPGNKCLSVSHRPREDRRRTKKTAGQKQSPSVGRESISERFPLRKQNSYLLAFALHRCFGGQNFIRKVQGRVIVGRGEAEIFSAQPYRIATLRAKICRRRKFSCTVTALSRQRRSALLAELCRDRVLVLTCPAFHPKPCGKGAEHRLAQGNFASWLVTDAIKQAQSGGAALPTLSSAHGIQKGFTALKFRLSGSRILFNSSSVSSSSST